MTSRNSKHYIQPESKVKARLSGFICADELRDKFSRAMSDMYKKEVPLYGALLELVKDVNQEVINNGEDLTDDETHRFSVERHGAIRVGTAKELSTLRKIFEVMGMFPVGYYDLSVAGVPVHSTAFRPVDEDSLKHNPFRIFTSLLRPELIGNDTLREQACKIVEKREIFSQKVILLLEKYHQQGGLTYAQATDFIEEVVRTFCWHSDAIVSTDIYEKMSREHRLVADIVCFRGPHINHLTPRTLDIDAVQERMKKAGITPKDVIEGPPRRQNAILLRQTSFRALSESINFTDGKYGNHVARFGEIEQRGIALTRKGRALYDSLLTTALQHEDAEMKTHNSLHQEYLEKAFREFPDDLEKLRCDDLAYFRYSKTVSRLEKADLNSLIKAGVVTFEPIIYEDFLPISAAGIFKSNLDNTIADEIGMRNMEQKDVFINALGVSIYDEFELYEKIQRESLEHLFL